MWPPHVHAWVSTCAHTHLHTHKHVGPAHTDQSLHITLTLQITFRFLEALENSCQSAYAGDNGKKNMFTPDEIKKITQSTCWCKRCGAQEATTFLKSLESQPCFPYFGRFWSVMDRADKVFSRKLKVKTQTGPVLLSVLLQLQLHRAQLRSGRRDIKPKAGILFQ